LALIDKNSRVTSKTPSQALALHWLTAIAAADIEGDGGSEALAQSD
jgi:hypothetical protein